MEVKHYNFIDPINLWNYPFMTRNIKADNRAKSLQLSPRKRQTNAFKHFVFTPAETEVERYEKERMQRCCGFGGRR